MKKELFIHLILATLFLIQLGCSEGRRPQEIHIKIIESTDVHGAIFPYDFLDGQEMLNSLSQFHTYLQEERQDTNQEVILLDNGDILQGHPPVYVSNFIDTSVIHVCAETMNYMGYDAGTVGNHDIEAGHAVYDKLVDEFEFPWMAANAIEVSTGEPYFQPYTIIKRKGFKIAILCLITPGIPKWLPPDLYRGMYFEDMVKSASYWMAEIRKKEDPDLLGLSVLGSSSKEAGRISELSKEENQDMLIAVSHPKINSQRSFASL